MEEIVHHKKYIMFALQELHLTTMSHKKFFRYHVSEEDMPLNCVTCHDTVPRWDAATCEFLLLV